jgi:hypothetical protein
MGGPYPELRPLYVQARDSFKRREALLEREIAFGKARGFDTKGWEQMLWSTRGKIAELEDAIDEIDRRD